MKKYSILISRKISRKIDSLPETVKKKYVALVEDLRDFGPVQKNWANYSKLGKNEYHCHLNYSYVACWKHEKKTIEIEVYYVGSREDAPY